MQLCKIELTEETFGKYERTSETLTVLICLEFIHSLTIAASSSIFASSIALS